MNSREAALARANKLRAHYAQITGLMVTGDAGLVRMMADLLTAMESRGMSIPEAGKMAHRIVFREATVEHAR